MELQQILYGLHDLANEEECVPAPQVLDESICHLLTSL